MSRTIIDIPDAQLHEVDNVCKLLGISRAEAVRRALREYLQNRESVQTDGFGLWKSGTATDPTGTGAVVGTAGAPLDGASNGLSATVTPARGR